MPVLVVRSHVHAMHRTSLVTTSALALTRIYRAVILKHDLVGILGRAGERVGIECESVILVYAAGVCIGSEGGGGSISSCS